MKNYDREWIKKRLTIASGFVMLGFLILLIRLLYIQAIEGEEYRRLSENNCIRLKSVEALRGLIYDRNGVLLVDNRPSFDLKIVVHDAKPVKKIIQKLSQLTKISSDKLMEKLIKKNIVSKFKPVLLKKNISRDQLAVIETHNSDLPGIVVNVSSKRNYIYKKSGAHLIGYLGEINSKELKSKKYIGVKQGDSIGRYGIEKSFENILRGKRGGEQVEVDVKGRLVRVIKTVNSVPGKNIFLTLDIQLQQKAEEMLNKLVGAIVVLDPNNGDVLVMASNPCFDPNDFIDGISVKKWNNIRSDPNQPMINKAIQGEYPPASTYKIVTAIAGLEKGIIDVNTSNFCLGHYKYGNRLYRCWKKFGHGKVNIYDAIEKSCDVFFYDLGKKIGVDILAQYARGCGLGKATGIKLEHEKTGLVPTSFWKKHKFGVPWQGGETLSIAIGQGFNLVTPLQMAVLIAAIGNNGVIYRPRLLKFVQSFDEDTIIKQEPEIIGRLQVSKKTLKIVKQGLLNVIQRDKGTASLIRMKGIKIAGKTGTAQVFNLTEKDRKQNKKLNYYLRDHAWFICYAPFEKPVIAVSVLIEHGEHGSSTAAPIAKKIIKTYLEKKGFFHGGS